MDWLERLTQFKKESRKTTDEIATLSGISKGTLNKLFAGQTRDPQLSTIKAVVHSLGHTLDDLEPLANDDAAMNNNLSEQALQVAQAYENAEPRAKEAVRFALNLPPEKEPGQPVNVVLQPPANFDQIKAQAETASELMAQRERASDPIKR